MPNPVVVETLKDVWTLVASSVRFGQVHKVDLAVQYIHTYKTSGESPPANNAQGVRFPGESIEIKSYYDIDVYIMAQENDASVRVDL